MAVNNASFAVELPNNAPSIGNVLQSGVALNERKSERNDALFEKQREFNQRNALAQQEKSATNRLHNLNSINKATDYSQYATADEHINGVMRSTLSDIKTQALKNIDADPLEVQSYIDNSMKEAVNWHSAAQTDLAAAKAQIADANKTYPNADLAAMNKVADESIFQKYLTKDANGQTRPLPYNIISKNPTNHLASLNDPKVLAGVINDTQPIYDFFDKQPKTAFEQDNYKNDKGNVIGKKVGGFTTPYSHLTADDKGNPILQPNYITAPSPITGKNNEPLRLATPEIKAAINAKPLVQASLDVEWEKYKQKNGLQDIDRHTDELLKDNFTYEFAKKHLPHDVKEVTVQKTPITRITNNIGGASAGNIMDLYAKTLERVNKSPQGAGIPLNELSAAEQQEYVKMANNIVGSPNDVTKLGQKDIALLKDANGVVNLVHVKTDDNGKQTIGEVIAPLDFTSVNLPAQTGVKTKNAVVAKGNAQTKAATPAPIQPVYKMK